MAVSNAAQRANLFVPANDILTSLSFSTQNLHNRTSEYLFETLVLSQTFFTFESLRGNFVHIFIGTRSKYF